MKRATFRFLLGLFILLTGVFNRSFAHPIPSGVVGSSLVAQQFSSYSNFEANQASQTFISKSTSSGSNREKQSFESSLFEKEEEDKSCSHKTVTTDRHQILISYAGVLNHFQQMVQERLQALTHSRLLIARDPITLLERFQI